MLRKVLGSVFAGLVLSALFVAPSAGAFPPPPGTTIRNVATEMCLHHNDPFVEGSPADQALCNRTVPGHLGWTFPQGGPSSRLIQSTYDWLCLDVPGTTGSVEPRTKVTRSKCSSADNQAFRTYVHGDGKWIVHELSGLCLDVDGLDAGASLTVETCTEADAKIWKFSPDTNF